MLEQRHILEAIGTLEALMLTADNDTDWLRWRGRIQEVREANGPFNEEQEQYIVEHCESRLHAYGVANFGGGQ